MLTTIMRYSDPMAKLRKYRGGIHLNEFEKQLVSKEGFIGIAESARLNITNFLTPHHEHRDTPKLGVVPKAMHATGTCCKRCLYIWHKIPRHRDLTEGEEIYTLTLILKWIKREVMGNRLD